MMNQGMMGSRERGFGLIEVLAAMMVLSIGVMSFAALQLRAVQTSGDSYYRTQAMAIAQDMAERVRSNASTVTMPVYLAATTWATAPTSAPTTCMTATCTDVQLASFDAQSVLYSAQTLLPQGQVSMIACPGSSMNCILVSWDGLPATAVSAPASGCISATTGAYMPPPTNKAMTPCVMLEML